ncbi:hypothetical protein C3M76_003765, partial [Salmonella enterica subsp. enterica]|nr:hypothetical protein [Salmonella enterica subsp. enterica]
ACGKSRNDEKSVSACMKKSGENDKREGRKPGKRPYNPMQKPPEYHG